MDVAYLAFDFLIDWSNIDNLKDKKKELNLMQRYRKELSDQKAGTQFNSYVEIQGFSSMT